MASTVSSHLVFCQPRPRPERTVIDEKVQIATVSLPFNDQNCVLSIYVQGSTAVIL